MTTADSEPLVITGPPDGGPGDWLGNGLSDGPGDGLVTASPHTRLPR
jgi:hypothetical protein